MTSTTFFDIILKFTVQILKWSPHFQIHSFNKFNHNFIIDDKIIDIPINSLQI